MDHFSRRSFAERTARWALIALGCFAFASFLHSVEWGLQGDTYSLIQGARGALSCLREGKVGDCPAAGQFSFLQLFWSGIWVALGLGDSAILRVLGGINLLISIHCVVLGLRALEKLEPLPSLQVPFFLRYGQFLWLAVWIGGCLPWYARTTFTEILSAWVLLLLWLTPRHSRRLEWTLAFASTTLKETAWVLVIPLLLFKPWTDLKEREDAGRRVPRVLPLLSLSAVAAGMIVNFGLNIFRFGSWKNLAYLHPTHFTPDLETRWVFFQGIWLAPLGGIIPFLPVFFGLWCIGWVFFFSRVFRIPAVPRDSRASSNHRSTWGEPDPRTLLFFLILPLTQSLLLSGWFAPLGWKTWGPRLMIPLLPLTALGLLISLARVSHHPKQPLLSFKLSTFSSLRSVIAVLFTLGLGFPHLKAVFDPPSLDRLLTLPLSGCTEVTVETSTDQYYRCTKEALAVKWSPQYFREYVGLPGAPELRGLLLLVLLFSGALLYRSLSAPQKTNSKTKPL